MPTIEEVKEHLLKSIIDAPIDCKLSVAQALSMVVNAEFADLSTQMHFAQQKPSPIAELLDRNFRIDQEFRNLQEPK